MFMSLTLPSNQTIRPDPGEGPRDPRLNLREASRLLSFAEIAAFFRRYARTILIPASVALLAAGVYVQTATPIFTARAQLIIDPRIPEQLRVQTGDSVVALDTAQVESQIAVLRSERIANIVVGKLNLGSAEDFQRRPSLLSRMHGEAPAEQPTPQSDLEAGRRTIEMFASGLDVRRAGLSYAIDLSFSSPNAQRAAEIANATAEAYISDQLESRSHAARVGGDWLEKRTLELRTQMNAAAQAVQEFKAGHDYRITRSRDDSPTAPAFRNTLEELETTAQIYRRVYESFLQGFTESVQRQSFPVSEARILTPATPPLGKSEPRSKLILSLAGLLGGMAGLGIALVRHHLDRSVRYAHQIRDELGIECLGSLAPITVQLGTGAPAKSSMHARRRASAKMGESLPAELGDETIRAEHYFDEVLKPGPSQFRAGLMGVKTLIEIAGRNRPIHCFGITSVNIGEGKSTLTSNLATLFAASGRRTLVIDADIHNRALTRKVAPGAKVGLVQVLNGSLSLERAALPVARGRVDLLPAAQPEGALNWNDLMSSDVMQLLVLEALQNYEIIIVDLPTLVPVNGALALCSLLDGVVLAVESGVTTVDELGEAAHWLDAARAKIIGAVITKAAD